jgi:hypothetical protein
MTLTALITMNAILAAVLVYALVHFLAHGLHADRKLRVARAAELRSLPERRAERVAA